jgi:predicted transposase/invertase (TIGR01784 family)
MYSEQEITQQLFNKPVEYYHEILKGTPLYEDLMRFYHEEKIQQKARFEAEKARAEAAEQARAEAKAARIAGAVRIIKQFGLPVEQVVQTLGLTDDEIAAVEAALKA